MGAPLISAAWRHVSLSDLDVDDVEHMRLPQLHECHALRCKKIKRSIISEHEKTGNHVKTATFHIPPVIEDRGRCRRLRPEDALHMAAIKTWRCSRPAEAPV